MEFRFTWFGLAALPAAPVWRLNVPVSVGSWYWLTTQTGTLAASSGRGAPNIRPFSESVAPPAPVVPLAVHSKVVVPSQPERQYFRVEPPMTGKLCEVPVQPLSRCASVARLGVRPILQGNGEGDLAREPR